MLGVMARADVRDPYCLPDEPRDWRQGIEGGVRGMRVAVMRRPGFAALLDADGEAMLQQAARVMAIIRFIATPLLDSVAAAFKAGTVGTIVGVDLGIPA